jgi:plasmid stabilization system protein ParE
MKLRILDLAEADLLSGFRFYERRSAAVGWYFLDSLSAEIESLHLYAGIHRKHLGYFRILSHRFPYAVYYRITGDEIQVWRVLDCRRDPRWIRKELRVT